MIKPYLDIDELYAVLQSRRREMQIPRHYSDYGMGFSEAIKIVALMYPAYFDDAQEIKDSPKEE